MSDKIPRVARYHKEAIKHFLQVLAVAGVKDPAELNPETLYRRVSFSESRNYRQIYPYLDPGQLLEDKVPDCFHRAWSSASETSFAAVQ